MKSCSAKNIDVNMSTAAKSHFNITSKGVLGGLINGGGLYPGGLIRGIKKMFGNDEIKRI